jgi:hypothetical protein
LDTNLEAKATARSKRLKKDESVKRVKKILRKAAAKIRLKEGVTKAELTELKISTVSGQFAPDATRPFGRIDTSNRFTHILFITDESARDLKRKPKGALGYEVYVKTGSEPPAHVGECRYEAIAVKSKCVVEFEGENIGKQAHYLLRWRMRDDSASGWSETLSATVTG